MIVTRRLPAHAWTCRVTLSSVANLTKILLEYQKGRSAHESDNVDKIIPQISTKPGTQTLFEKKELSMRLHTYKITRLVQ